MFSDKKSEYELLNQCFDDLFPLCRSITGYGIEQSIDYLSQYMPLNLEKIPSRTQVFDWETPDEWQFHRARLWGPDGQLICDSEINNLHVVSYSEPVEKSLELEELQGHLHSLEDLPEAIPYVTSYYKRTWGFCLSHRDRAALKPGVYKVKIESEFDDKGGVPFASCVLAGESDREVLLSSYLCHPSLANNELSGPLVLLGLYRRIASWPKRRFSYRFLLNPETIGSLCFIKNYQSHLRAKLEYGLILTCMGGAEKGLRYKASRRSDSVFDALFRLKEQEVESYAYQDFTPINGSDERQFCAPGFNFPIGQLAKTPYGMYDGYHNSLDNKASMTIESLIEAIDQVETLLLDAELAGAPVNQSPYGEPQLGKRGLYPNMNSHQHSLYSSDNVRDGREMLNAILTVLSMADGSTTTVEMAEACGFSFNEIKSVIETLEQEGLLKFNVPPLA